VGVVETDEDGADKTKPEVDSKDRAMHRKMSAISDFWT